MKTFTNTTRFQFGTLAVVIFGLLLHTGCSQFASTSANPMNWFGETEKSAAEIPDRILPIWTDTVLHQPNQKGVRGFGGRVYFYKDGDDAPIQVDGNVTVYVFDGDYNSVDPTKPLKKYVITSAQLEKLVSKSTLGVSYSLWIPWEEVGGASKKLNLIARFDGKEGGTVISNSSTKLLPGIDTPKNRLDIQQQVSKEPENKFGVAQVSYLTADKSAESTTISGTTKSDTTIFSIDLPNSMEQKINASVGESDLGKPNPPQIPNRSGPVRAINFDGAPRANEVSSQQDFYRDSRASNKVNNESVTSVSGNSVTTVSSNDPRQVSNPSNVTVGKVGSQARVIGSRLQSHFGPRRFRARTESTTPQDSVLLRTQPHRATWQTGLPPTPRSNR